MKKNVLALVCAATLMCGSVLTVSADSVTADKVTEIDSAVNDAVNDVLSDVSKDDVKVEVSSETGNIVVEVKQDSNKGSNVSNVKVNVAVDESSRLQAAEAAKAAVEAVSAEQKEEAVSAVKGLEGVPSDATAAEEVTVTALDFSDQKTSKAVAQIAAEVAKQVNTSVKNAGSNKQVAKVDTVVVEISASSAKGVVSLSASALSSSAVKIDTAKVNSGNQKVYALHFNGSSVTRHECKLVNGIISFYMPSFSPVAIVVEEIADVTPVGEDRDDDDDDDAAPAGTPASTTTAPTSPKTADASVAVMAMAALMSAAGLVVSKRRMKA